MTQLLPGSFLKTSPERHWLSSVLPCWPAPYSQCEGTGNSCFRTGSSPSLSLLGVGWGRCQGPRLDGVVSGRVPPAVEQNESGRPTGAQLLVGTRHAGGHPECERPEGVTGKVARWLAQVGSRSGRVQIGSGRHLLVQGWADKRSLPEDESPV